MVASGNISKSQPQCSNISYHSKDISELFPTASMSSYFILIEGAPGIGKTVLSKEIAYQWATNKLLTFKKLVFLLFLRDPNLKNMVILENLTQYLCNNTKRGAELSEYLLQTKGKDLTIIFDGYDEMSEEDRSNSLVTKIISRNVLQECDLVITSRPTASLHLRDTADCRVEVLGFTEEDRLDYIQHALEGSDEKIKILQSYLQSNSTINALCYVPLNMTILLCLYEDIDTSPNNTLNIDNIKEIGLPNTQTEMYEKFILMTITRCIKRNDKKFSGKYLKISELPEPYNEIFNELLQLAYHALTKDKIVFNSDEEFVQQFCKNLKSGNCEGLGLLKVTEHVNNVSFHFLHFSIQEYLAAYYIASLSSSRQFQLLKDTFWDIHYFNTWIMYVGITGGKKLAWKHYISGNWFMLSTKIFKSSKISKSLLNDKIKSLHLFQCFAEIGNKELVGKIFKDKVIDLSHQTLLPRDINTLCFFLLRSVNKHWTKIDLSNCNIGSIGSDILHKTFLDKSRDILCIDTVDFSNNLLQNQSILNLLDVVNFWHASEVIINEDCDNYDNLFKLCLNKFSLYSDEDCSQTVLVGPFLFAHKIDHQLMYNQLTNLTNLTGLYLNYFNYQIVNSRFHELKLKLNLSKLHVIGKNLTVEFLVATVQTTKEVDSIYIYDNTLSDEDVNYMSSLILYKTNSTTTGIWVVIGSTKILGNLHKLFTLNKKLSPAEIFNLANSIRRLCSGNSVSTTDFVNNHNELEDQFIFEDLRNLLYKNVSKCDINFCMMENNLLIANGVNYSDLSEALFLNDHLTSVYVKTFKINATKIEPMVNLISKQKLLQRLYIFDSLLEPYCLKELYEGLLTGIPWLKELLIHSTDSSCIAVTSDLLAVQTIKSNTSVLLIACDMLIGWHPTSRQLSLILQLQLNIMAWKLSNCHIDVQTFYQLAIMLTDLSELDISGCDLQECELQELKQYSKPFLKKLTKVDISRIKITSQAFTDMVRVLSSATKLNDLVVSHNNLSIVNTSKLLNRLCLRKLDISFSAINDKTAKDIAKFLSQSIELEELDISSCDLQPEAVATIFKGMKSILHLSKLNVSHNDINDEAANDLAEILSHNVGLKELDLSYNCLHVKGAVTIFKRMKSILQLTKFSISHNSITDEVTDDLAELLSQNVGLKELDLSYNCLQAAGAITILKRMKSILHLSKFSISHNNITDEVTDDLAELLSRNIGLKELDLSYNCLKPAGAITIFKAMNSISHLSKLSINLNSITDKAADHLAGILSQNVGLNYLNLSYNFLRAAGATIVCKRMSTLTNLIKFNISNNNISSEAAHDIAAVLSQNKSLKELDLSFNNLGASGAVRIFLSMKSFTGLIKLNVGGIKMTDFAADDVANILNNNVNLKELDLSYNNIQAVGAAEIFKNTVNLSLNKLNISHNNITDQGVDNIAAFISQNTELEELHFSHNNLQAAGAVKICRTNISKLIKLNISHNNISNKASNDIATFLSHNKKLQLLDLSYNNLGFISIFKNMQSPNKLSVLKINNCCIISEAAKELATVLLCSSKLKEIDLSHTDLSTTDAIKIFEGMRNILDLVAIDISHNMITDEAADSIANVLLCNTKLKELDMSHNNFSASGIVSIFQEMKVSNLITLNISHNMITDEAADSIATVLSHNSNLRTLFVSSNYLRSAGCVKILSGSKNMKGLTNLDISCNKITINTADTSATSELTFVHTADATIFKTMKNISGLKILNIANIIINDAAALDDLVAVLSQNNELKELDISSNDLQTAGAFKVFQNIKHFTSLTKLNIANNRITDEATEHIANVLSNCSELVELNLSHNDFHNLGALNCITVSNLTKIDLNNNNIDEQTVNELSIFLSCCTKLEELNLANNNLQTAGAVKLFKKLTCNALKIINFSGNSIKLNAANHIAISLSKSNKLQEIDLSCNALEAPGIKKILAALNISNLTKLNISNTNIRGGYLVQSILVRAVNLVSLDFSYNEIYLANVNQCCSDLVQLNMCNNGITDKAAPALALVLSGNSKLQELDISYNNLEATGISKIFGKLDISHLTKLNISNNVIDDQAADIVGSFLSKNTKLRELEISCNNLNESGTKTLCKRITNLPKLTKLKFGGNNFSHLAADHVAEVLLCNTKLEEIDISNNNLLAAGAVSIFNGMKNIFTLRIVNISHNWITYEAADSIAAVLSQNTHLRKVYLAKNDFAANGIMALCREMSNILYLTHLDMSYNKITDEAAHDIATLLFHNSELKEVDLSNNLMQTPGVTIMCKVISTLANLRKLNISNNNIIGETACDIANALSKIKPLEELSLNYDLEESSPIKVFLTMKNFTTCSIKLNVGDAKMSDLIVHNIAAVLNDAIKLKELDLSYNNLDAMGISNIFKKLNISHLTKINVCHNLIREQAADIVGSFLSQNAKLEELDISCNNLYESGTKTLCKRITNLSKLTKLKVGGNDFTHLAADDVAEVILNNIELEEIDISDNNLLTAGAVSIFNGMKNVFTLRNVNISHNWITYKAVDNIIAVLSQNTDLKELYLANNYLEASGIIALCGGMSKISCLTHLDMSCNKITDEAARNIAKLLFHNPELKEVDLSNNLIRGTGVTKILNVVSSHSNLNKMNICKNAITDEAADAIANFLSQSSKLKEFDVSYNYLQAVSAVKIFKAIRSSNLSKLKVNNNLITDDAARDIMNVLSTVTTLKEVNLKGNKITIHSIPKIAYQKPQN